MPFVFRQVDEEYIKEWCSLRETYGTPHHKENPEFLPEIPQYGVFFSIGYQASEENSTALEADEVIAFLAANPLSHYVIGENFLGSTPILWFTNDDDATHFMLRFG